MTREEKEAVNQLIDVVSNMLVILQAHGILLAGEYDGNRDKLMDAKGLLL